MTDRTEELLDEVATYADRLADSDKLADKGSMATAEALAELYEKREWVDEWLGQKPIRERSAYIGGRPPQPDSRNRFAQWLVWKQQQRQKRSLRSPQTYRLLAAQEIRVLVPMGTITSERLLRPFNWLRKYRYADCIPEVWKRAVELAGSADQVTNAHTRQALADWKRDVLGTSGTKAAITTAKAEQHRLKAQTAVDILWADGDPTEVEKFRQWFDNYLRVRRVA